ncbi:hypothetical protein FACS1894110_17590 [Spirochaetia bacterium]|nr:hypothetical protein FACS1894110_17590 [Spirochaetia bacterium]
MNKTFRGGISAMAAVLLAASLLVTGCGTTGGSETQKPETEVRALGLSLDESLRRYMGPEQQTWGDEAVNVYFLDHLRFEEFKAELEAGGEYQQIDSWNDDNRDWERGKTFARLSVRRDGAVELDLCREDNSRSGYRYKKAASNGSRAALGPKLDASLRKYIGPNLQTWGDEAVNVYFLDPLNFEEFRVELDAGVEYFQTGSSNNDNRDWERGKTFARWAVRPDGRMELGLYKKDNSGVVYRYEKTAELAAKLGGEGKAVMDGSTIRLSGDVNLTTGFTVPRGFTLAVPAGITLDLMAEGARFELQNGAKLTVDGTVNTSGGGLRLGEGAVVINGSGTISLKSKGRLLNIDGKRHLTLEGVTLIGIEDNDNSLVQVGGGGEFVMKSGAITGNTRIGNDGGGVNVGENGTFTMEGGEISGNTARNGGGVNVWKGTFTMKSGAISGNTAPNGDRTGVGGGVNVNGTFTMEGGEISGNTSAKFGGGVIVNKGGIFSKTGGTIYGDTDNIHTPGSTENTANIGNAVFLGRGGRPDPNLLRNSTAGEGDNMSWDGTNAEGFDGETTAG